MMGPKPPPGPPRPNPCVPENRAGRHHPRWAVQAFLLRSWTGGGIDRPYAPTYHRTRFGARQQVRRLQRSFAPGMARIEVRPEHAGARDAD